jgi:hypothetical protein
MISTISLAVTKMSVIESLVLLSKGDVFKMPSEISEGGKVIL